MEEARTFLDSYLADERRALIRDATTLKRRLNASTLTRDGMILMRSQSGDAPAMRVPVRSAFEAVRSGEMAFSQREDINYRLKGFLR